MVPSELLDHSSSSRGAITANQIGPVVQLSDGARKRANVVGWDNESVETVQNDISRFPRRDLCQSASCRLIRCFGTSLKRGRKDMNGTCSIYVFDVLSESKHLHVSRYVIQIRFDFLMRMPGKPKLRVWQFQLFPCVEQSMYSFPFNQSTNKNRTKKRRRRPRL